MADDPKAWALMGRYNRQDVKLLEKLYVALLPWIQNLVWLREASEAGSGGDGSPDVSAVSLPDVWHVDAWHVP
jgi:hypothetical protein